MIPRILGACGRFACTRYRLVLFISIALTALSLLPILRTKSRVSASVRKLMPTDNASARAFNRALNDFGTADEVLVVVRVTQPKETEAIRPFIIKLAEALRSHPEFVDAYCRFVRPEEAGFLEKEIVTRGMLYLPPEASQELADLLQRKTIIRNTKKTLNKLTAPGISSDKERLIKLNVLGILPLFQKYMAQSYNSFNSGAPGNLLMDVGEKDAVILVAAQPNGPAQRLEYSSKIMELVRKEAFQIFGEGRTGWISESVWWQPWTWGDGHEAVVGELPPALRSYVQVEFAGGYEAAVRYTSHIQSSLLSTLLTSMIGVLLIFGYFYRRYGVMVYVGFPLVMVVCWTIGAGYLIFGKINMISSAFAAVLVGLGVDYAIHIYNRYVEERSRGLDVENAFVTSLEQTGHGVLVGMLTTSMSFFALHVTRFRGLSQFGTLAGVGLALALPAMLFVLPALVTWRSKRGKGESARALLSAEFGLHRLTGFILTKPRLIAIAALLLAGFSALTALYGPNKVRFDERLASLRPTHDRVFVLGEEISERFTKKSPTRQMLLISGTSEAEAMNRSASILPELERLQKNGDLKAFELITSRIPAPVNQAKAKALLRKIDFDAASQHLSAALEKYGLYREDFQESFDFLKNHSSLSRNASPALPSQFKGTPLWRLVRRLVTRQKIRYKCNGSVAEALQEGQSLTLAKIPTSRSGDRYFTAGTKVLPQDPDFLKALGIARVRVSAEQDGPAKEVEITALAARISAGEKLNYSSEPKRADGTRLFDRGSSVTAEMADYLRQVRCKEISCYGELWSVLGYIYPPNQHVGLELSDQWLRLVRNRLGVDDENILLTGTMVVAHDLATIVKEDFLMISLAVTAIAALVLTLCYREIRRVLFSLAPIFLALLFLVGFMSAGGIYFNFINVLVVPVIIGLGVDNGIHLVHRYFGSGCDIRPTVAETGRAIVITNLTSMVGFGSLWLGSYSGMRSMGMLSVLGLGMSLIASLVVLPALLVWLQKPQLKGGAAEGDTNI